jgi:hypothetical protein
MEPSASISYPEGEKVMKCVSKQVTKIMLVLVLLVGGAGIVFG